MIVKTNKLLHWRYI